MPLLIRRKAAFDIESVHEIEKRTNHDVIAFLEDVASHVGPASRWIHQGLTSSDLLDTTLAVQMNSSCAILLDDLNHLRDAIARRAIEHKFTPMIGRSHGIHAEPISFGLKLALMFDEFSRATQRLLANARAHPRWERSAAQSARTRTSTRASKSSSARSSASGLRRFPRRSSSAIVMRNS